MLVLRSCSRRRALCKGLLPPVAAIKPSLNGGPGRRLSTIEVPHPLFSVDKELILETKYLGRLSWFLPHVNIKEAKWKVAQYKNKSLKAAHDVFIRMNGPKLRDTLLTSSNKLGRTIKDRNIPLRYAQSKDQLRGFLKSLNTYGAMHQSKRFTSKAVSAAASNEAKPPPVIKSPPKVAPPPSSGGAALKAAPAAPPIALEAASSSKGPTCPPKGKQPTLKKGGVPSTSAPSVEATTNSPLSNEMVYQKWEELKGKFPGWQKAIARRLQQIQDIINKRVPK